MNIFKRYIALHLGLEWQSMKGVSGYYNNARFRDALLAGAFYQQDPLAEKYYPLSPYHYGMNNPIKFQDNNGNDCRISIKGNNITITANVYIYNEQYSNLSLNALAEVYQSDIDNNWGKITTYHDDISETDFNIDWDVKVESKDSDPGSTIEYDFNGVNNYMMISNDNISRVRDTNNGYLRASNLENANPMSHELGHILGLDDKYNILNKKPIQGWEGNIMSMPAGKGKVEQKNLDILFQKIKYLFPLAIMFPDIENNFYITSESQEDQKGVPRWVIGHK